VRLLRASSRPVETDRLSTRPPTHRSAVPPRDAPAALLHARPGRHLAGASLRGPKTPHAGQTSRRGRRVIATPLTSPFPRTFLRGSIRSLEAPRSASSERPPPDLRADQRHHRHERPRYDDVRSSKEGISTPHSMRSPPIGRCILRPIRVLRARLRALRCHVATVYTPPKGFLASLYARRGTSRPTSHDSAPRVIRALIARTPKGQSNIACIVACSSPLSTHFRVGFLRPCVRGVCALRCLWDRPARTQDGSSRRLPRRASVTHPHRQPSSRYSAETT